MTISTATARNWKSRLAAAAATSALLGAGAPAIAQDQADAAEDAGRDQIIVSAQRRDEDIQDVPISLTAVTAEDIETKQIRDVLDLQAYAPNVFISNGTGTANSARIFFRGVGEDESRGAIDPAVGIYVDGVYLGRTVGSLFDVVDVERIEVLRGPQGTLYGRNTNGGAIRLISVRPQDETTGDIELGAGSDGRLSARGVGNVALSDATAFRLAGQYKRRDGFHELRPNGDLADLARDVGEEEVFSVRASLSHELNPNWRMLVSIDHTQDDSDPTPNSIIDSSDFANVVTDEDGDIFTVEPQPGTTCSSAVPVAFRPIGCFTDFSSSIEIFGASVNIEGDLGDLDFTSVTSFRSMGDDLSTQIGSPFVQETQQEQYSQEFTLASDFDSGLNYVAGVYFYNEEVDLDTVFFFPFSVSVDTQAFAVFGQTEVDLTDRLTLTGGLRFTTEERSFNGALLANLGFDGTRQESVTTENITSTFKLDYALTDDVMVYGSFATGFKSPGFSPDCFSPTACFLPVSEENLESYEVGLRSDLFDDRMRFNATYFFNNYDDLQISATVPGLGFTRSNAAEAQIQGLEIEANFYPSDNFEIFANIGVLDAEYQNLTELQAATLTNSGASCPGGVATVECALDLELKNAPEFKATVGALIDIPVQQGMFQLGGDIAFEEDSFALVANNPGSVVEPGLTFNGRVAYRPTDADWRIAVWGRNLSDREYFRAATAPNAVFAVPPRTWGVDIGKRF